VNLLALAWAAQCAAAVTGVLLARRRPAHRPAAVALVLLASAVALRWGLVYGVLLPARAAMPDRAAPFSDPLALAAVYLDGAAVLATVAVVPGLALAVATTRPRRAVAVVAALWAVASIVLAALYPLPVVRGEGLRRVYLAAELAGVAVAVGALARRARRPESPGSPEAIAVALLVADVGALLAPLSPWREGVFVARYDVTQIIVLVVFLVLAFYQGILWRYVD
jgi:hypothetical protein